MKKSGRYLNLSFGRAFALGLLTLGGILSFQNCGTYQAVTNPLYDREILASCLGPTCVEDLNYLTIQIGNVDPILLTRTTEKSLDIGGFCDTAGFPDSKIYVEVKNGTTSVLAPYQSSAKCDANGRFRVLIDLPTNYNYDLAHSVVLTFRAVDSKGNEYDHPTGVNRREIALLTAP